MIERRDFLKLAAAAPFAATAAAAPASAHTVQSLLHVLTVPTDAAKHVLYA